MSTTTSHGLAFTRYDTTDVPVADRFESWQHRLTDAFRLSMPDGLPRTALSARTSVWNLDTLMLGPRTCGAHTLTRDAHTVRTSPLEHYKLHARLQGPGSTRVDADGRRLEIAGGSFVITDLTRPERLEIDAGSALVLFVPREALDRLLPSHTDLHGATATSASGAMLVDHLQALVREMPQMKPEEVHHVSEAIVRLLAASLAPTVSTPGSLRPRSDDALRREIGRYIEEHLCDATLNAASLAARFRMSRASLYRLFEPLGGVASHIKEQRLARIHALLVQGARGMPLARLAESHGFFNPTHFSRDFREQFGYRPRDLLMRHTDALEPKRVVELPVFGRWLESMHG